MFTIKWNLVIWLDVGPIRVLIYDAQILLNGQCIVSYHIQWFTFMIKIHVPPMSTACPCCIHAVLWHHKVD